MNNEESNGWCWVIEDGEWQSAASREAAIKAANDCGKEFFSDDPCYKEFHIGTKRPATLDDLNFDGVFDFDAFQERLSDDNASEYPEDNSFPDLKIGEQAEFEIHMGKCAKEWLASKGFVPDWWVPENVETLQLDKATVPA